MARRQGFLAFLAAASFLGWPLCAAAAEGPAAASSPAADSSGAADQRVWLSDLEEQDAKVGWGAFGKKGRAGFEDVPIALNGIPSPHGLGMHPDSSVSYQLDGKYRTFRAAAAVNDSSPGFERPVIFSVEADGKPVWRSWRLNAAHGCQPVMLDVTDVKRLTLKTFYDPERQGNGAWAHVVWIEPYVSAAAADPELLKALDPQNFRQAEERAAYMQRLVQLFRTGKFAELESLATAARAEKVSFDRQPRILWFYQALAHPGRGEEHAQFAYLEQLKRWHTAVPNSCIPVIAAAWVWLDMAEALRAEATRPLGDEGLGLFRERVARAESFLTAAEKLDQRDTEYYAAQIEAQSIEKFAEDKIDDLMDEGLQLDPNYSKIYLARAPYLLPRYGGKEGDFGRLAETVKKRLGGQEGELAFAQIAIVALLDKPSRYRSDEFNGEELSKALVLYCRERASNSAQVQLVCRVACAAGDFDTARTAFELLTPGDCHPRLWANAQEMEAWRARVNSEPPVKQDKHKADNKKIDDKKHEDKKTDDKKPAEAKPAEEKPDSKQSDSETASGAKAADGKPGGP